VERHVFRYLGLKIIAGSGAYVHFNCKKFSHTHRHIPHDKRSVGILLFVQTAGTNKASRHSSGVCVKTDEVQYTVIHCVCVCVQTNMLGYTVLCKVGFRTDEVQYTVM
jgi:hypothetical protein